MKALPSVEALWNKNKDRGLHIFLVESQGGTMEALKQYAANRGLTFPIAIRNSCDFSKYPGGRGLPYAFVVGPDGKVVWQGRKGYEAVCEEQLDRIKYPGLGKLEVAKECEKAAVEFGAGDYARARDEAAKVKEKESGDDGSKDAVADAEFIIKRVDARIDSLNKRIEAAKAKRDYPTAFELLEELSGKAYHGLDAADKAKDELKELKKDKDVKKEMHAWDALERVEKANERARDDASKKKNLEKFAEHYEGTAAADKAKAEAGKLSD